MIEVIQPKEGSPEPLARPAALRRFDLSTRPSGYDRYLRKAAVANVALLYSMQTGVAPRKCLREL